MEKKGRKRKKRRGRADRSSESFGESHIFKDTEAELLRSREPQSFGEEVPTPAVSLPTRS
jgi:hypothetical protein